MLPKSTRLGSPLTLQKWLQERAQKNGWVDRIASNQTGRGNKANFKLTKIGEAMVVEASGLFPASTPELDALSSMQAVADSKRTFILFANASLASTLKNETIKERLEKLEDTIQEFLEDIEDATTSNQSPDDEPTLDEWRRRQREYHLMEERLRFLAHRYQYSLSTTKGRKQYRRAILSHDRVSRAMEDFAISHQIGKNAFGNYHITMKILKKARLGHAKFETIMKRPLTPSEYKELKDLEKSWERHWELNAPEKRLKLAILFCNDRVTKQMVEQGKVLTTDPPQDEDWRTCAYKPVQDIVRNLPSMELLIAERELWEAVYKDKYAKIVYLWARAKDDELEYAGGLDGPNLPKFELAPPFSPRMRRMYFRTVHDSLVGEIRNRQLSNEILPRPNAKYPEDLIDAIAQHRPEIGKKFEVKKGRDEIEVIFQDPDPKYVKRLRSSMLERRI